jgi:hypothetical protein
MSLRIMEIKVIEYDWKQLHYKKEEVVSFLLDQVFEMSKNILPPPNEYVEASKNLELIRSRLSKINNLIQKSTEIQDKMITEVALTTSENNKLKQKISELVGSKI